MHVMTCEEISEFNLDNKYKSYIKISKENYQFSSGNFIR